MQNSLVTRDHVALFNVNSYVTACYTVYSRYVFSTVSTYVAYVPVSRGLEKHHILSVSIFSGHVNNIRREA